MIKLPRLLAAATLVSGTAFAQAPAPASPHTFTGKLALYSEYEYRGLAQTSEDPALQLTLTDEENRELVSRWVLPREYLEPGRFAELVARGIEAGGEAALSVHFDASRTRATGYELVLFYPS